MATFDLRILHYHVEVLFLPVCQLESPMQHQYRHVSKQPQVQDKEMHCIDDEVIQADITHPGALMLQISHEYPGGQHEQVGNSCAKDSFGVAASRPLDVGHFAEAGTDAENCPHPSKQSGGLGEVEPGPDDLVVAVRAVRVVQVSGTRHEILHPVDVQEQVLPREHNEHEGGQQTDQQQPIEYILLGIRLQYR